VRELDASTIQLEWIVDAYNLMFAALVLAAGNLGDRVGRKGVLLAGLAVFGAATLAGGFGENPGQLIAARAAMGIGAALIFPATLSLLTNVFTERRERARAIGLWGATTGSGSPWGRSSAAGSSNASTGRACSSPSPPSRRGGAPGRRQRPDLP
jgi:MFS family permease